MKDTMFDEALSEVTEVSSYKIFADGTVISMKR